MKTLDEVKREISGILELNKKQNEIPNKELRAARKRIQFLKSALLYLESNPDPAFVLKQKEQCEHKILVLNRRLDEFIAQAPVSIVERVKNIKQYYYQNEAPNELRDIKDAKSQLETLKYIIQ